MYDPAEFVEFTNSCAEDGGPCEAGGPVDPAGNHWTGVAWDKTTAATGPWTFVGQEAVHPNGLNSVPGQEEWTIRRWEAAEAAEATAIWHVRKTNPAGAGVTGRLFHNGTEIDFASIVGADTAGVLKVIDLDLSPGDLVELALTPVGPTGDTGDASDGSANWLRLVGRGEDPDPGEVFRRGDADNNGSVQLTDAIGILGFLFLGEAAPTCFDAADADDNGSVQLTDAIGILGFLFLGEAPPAHPGPSDCGEDIAPADPSDGLDCAEYTNC